MITQNSTSSTLFVAILTGAGFALGAFLVKSLLDAAGAKQSCI